jgi:hypothetical protein
MISHASNKHPIFPERSLSALWSPVHLPTLSLLQWPGPSKDNALLCLELHMHKSKHSCDLPLSWFSHRLLGKEPRQSLSRRTAEIIAEKEPLVPIYNNINMSCHIMSVKISSCKAGAGTGLSSNAPVLDTTCKGSCRVNGISTGQIVSYILYIVISRPLAFLIS